MRFFLDLAEKEYVVRLAASVQNNLHLGDSVHIDPSINYFAFQYLSETIYFLSNSDYLLKEILFKRCFGARLGADLFVDWHLVNYFGIPTR